MKLIIAIVHDEDSPRLLAELNRASYRVTKLNSSGGFLRSGNTTLMVVVDDEQLDDVFGIIRKYSSSRQTAINSSIIASSLGGTFIPYPVEVMVGGATVFVLNVERFEKM